MYIDTSALVKLYVAEPDSDACEAIVLGSALVSSRLLYCEFNSALLAKVQRGIISAEFKIEVWQEFEKDITTRKIQLVSLDDMLVKEATELLSELHPDVALRTLDAIHLATYLSVETGPLFTTDQRMRHAAAHLGLPVAG
jgi:predicted nucleic acid-binding protein